MQNQFTIYYEMTAASSAFRERRKVVLIPCLKFAMPDQVDPGVQLVTQSSPSKAFPGADRQCRFICLGAR